jgi:O-antigen ligase
VLGMLWADASLGDRVHALGGIYKLLAIPLVLIQIRRSDQAPRALGAFMVSCTALLVLSWVLLRWPDLLLHLFSITHELGVPVRDHIVQSAEFSICVFALLHLSVDMWSKQRHALALALSALALAFLLNMFFVSTSRTAMIVLPVLLVLMGFQRFGWRGIAVVSVAVVIAAATAWATSPYLRERIYSVGEETKAYLNHNAGTSFGFRLEFWRKSISFVSEAPVFGHGTGSTSNLFRSVAAGNEGAASSITENPHNQTLVVAVQVGFVGAATLWAMWITHLLMFRGSGLFAWLGFGVVVQSIVSSLANSHLTDFGPGWLYVLGVGVLGGAVLRDRTIAGPPEQAARSGQGSPAAPARDALEPSLKASHAADRPG